MSDERKKRGWVFWLPVWLALPVLYVLSSGPMTNIAWHSHDTFMPAALTDGTPVAVIGAIRDTDFGEWFPIVYAPLIWASEQSWGEPVNWYWELFYF